MNDNDDKIQQMLARYMEQEEDQDILSALSWGNNITGSNTAVGGGGRERNERLFCMSWRWKSARRRKL